MEFSPSVCCSNGLVRWSPDGTLLAHAVAARVLIRQADSLKVLCSHCCLDCVDSIFWSPTSEFVAASIRGLGVTHVFCVSDQAWSAKISEGAIGLSWSRFAPDGRHIISQSEFNIKLTIWSLVSKQVRYIKHAECLDFSPDGNHVAVAEKNSSSEPNSVSVAIYDCFDWEEVNRVATRCAEVAGVAWEPTKGDRFAVWNGALESVFQVFTSGGTLVMDHSIAEAGLGVRSLRWLPCGQLILVAARGERRLRIFNAVNCTYFSALDHGDVVSGDDLVTSDCAVFEEADLPDEDIDGRVIQEWLNAKDAVYESVSSRPFRLITNKRTCSTSSHTGISEMLSSPNGRHIATVDDSCPSAVWVWDLQELRLCAVLSHSHRVTCLSWEPGAEKTRLAVLTGGSPAPKVFLWSLLGAVALRIPVADEGDVVIPSKVRWNPQGRGAMCLVGKDRFVCSKISKRATLKGLAIINAGRSGVGHEQTT